MSGCKHRAARPAASPATWPQVRDVSPHPGPHGHCGPLWGEAGVSVGSGAAYRPWHKERDTTVVSRIVLGLQALLGVAPLSPSNGASSHAQERLLGSPSTPVVSSTWRPTLSPHAVSPRSLCPGVWRGAWCLLTSMVQQKELSPPEPLLPWWLLPRRNLGWLVGAGSHQPQALVLWCVPTGSPAGWHGARWCCSPSSWQQVRTLLGGWHG